MSKLIPQNWNDTLSLFLLVGIPALWVAFTLPPSVEGATIVVWTLVAQFYFRRTPAEAGVTTSTTTTDSTTTGTTTRTGTPAEPEGPTVVPHG